MAWPRPQVQEHFITCTVKRFSNGYWYIAYLTGPEGTWAYGDVIALLNTGLHRFFTYNGVTTAEIKVFQGTFAPYLKTLSDGVESNNLDLLPPC